LGIVAPVDDIPQDTSDWSTLVNGWDIKVNPYLKKWVVHYPLSANAGEIGNMIIAWHSSYFKADDGLFKTIFTSLPLLNVWDEVLVYKKKTAEEYKKELEMTSSSSKKSWDATTKVEPFAQFSYVIRNSYEIKSTDTWILNSRPQTSHLTVFTCTPIGSNKNRWYIDAELR
jgi:sortase (surface protein transpeptidase)